MYFVKEKVIWVSIETMSWAAEWLRKRRRTFHMEDLFTGGSRDDTTCATNLGCFKLNIGQNVFLIGAMRRLSTAPSGIRIHVRFWTFDVMCTTETQQHTENKDASSLGSLSIHEKIQL